jgi:hypothetical protein
LVGHRRPVGRRVDDAQHDAVDPYPLLAALARNCLDEADYAEFAHAVANPFSPFLAATRLKTCTIGPPPCATSTGMASLVTIAAVTRRREEAATIWIALDACARTLAGKPAAATTQRRKRAVFHNAVR